MNRSVVYLLFASLVLLGCSPEPPLPANVAAAYASPTNVAALAGAPLDACKQASGLGKHGDNIVDAEGVYNPGMTVAMGKQFQKGPAPLIPYADRIRAYTLDSRGVDIFGRSIHDEVVCYYEHLDGNLRYLTNLRPDGDGRASVVAVNDAVLTAYAIMAGKNVATVRLLGAYAN